MESTHDMCVSFFFVMLTLLRERRIGSGNGFMSTFFSVIIKPCLTF